jgi:membrane protein DedA with SNARE-associated domain
MNFRSPHARRAALVLTVLAALSSVWFGMRTYSSFVLLRSAYQVGMPQSSSVRGWMTIRYVATIYRVPESILIAHLGLPPDISSDTSLKSLAEREHISPFKYVQRVQQSLAEIASIAPSSDEGTPSGRWNQFIDNVLSALLRFGYPALALILFLGALGLPLPNGLSAVIAGSLAAAGRMSWSAAILIAITSSVLGDMIAYGLGRFVGGRLLEHWGHWIGYTRDRQARMQVLLQRWGGVLVVVTRTLVSSVSSVVGLVAGISHYRASTFFAFVLLGRILWTSAYIGLGYSIGGSLESATSFLAALTGLLLSLIVAAAAGFVSRPMSRSGK